MTDSRHPARSSEFLSRLYDGEIDAAARTAFEAHRVSCKECREAAAAFEGTLAAFRSAPTAPPAGDLSARILRNIRAQSPSRRPFGVTFGIDIRWAGVFIAALVVVLISAPALLRRPTLSPATAPPNAIPARILDEPAAKDAASAALAPSPRREAAPPAFAPAPAAQAPLAKSEGAVAPPREASADEKKPRVAAAAPPPQKAAAPAQTLARRATAPESPGGEADAVSSSELAAATVRLSVRALDGQGSAPVLSFHPPDERLAALRGQEFVLIVEAQGHVREVSPTANDGFAPKMKAQSARADSAFAPSDVLRELRFAPGDRPRRLLVRVD